MTDAVRKARAHNIATEEIVRDSSLGDTPKNDVFVTLVKQPILREKCREKYSLAIPHYRAGSGVYFMNHFLNRQFIGRLHDKYLQAVAPDEKA